MWHDFFTYAIPAVFLFLGTLIPKIMEGFRSKDNVAIDREKNLYTRVYELWEQEIERHETCQMEVARMHRQLTKLLLQCAKHGIFVNDEGEVSGRVLQNPGYSASERDG